MNKSDIISQIITHYNELDETCIDALSSMTQVVFFEKGETIVKENQYADKTYFVAQGCVRAYYLKDGKDITDWFAFENGFVSSINSYFLNVPSPHFIATLEDSWLLEIKREDAHLLMEKYRAFEKLSFLIVTQTMLELQQRIVSIQFENAQQKYANLLAIRPDITQRVPLTHIASYLGITLETLSRIRAKKRI